MLTVKGCGMMWTLEYLEQDKVLVTLVTPPVKSTGPKPGPRRREDGFQQGTQLGIRVKPDSGKQVDIFSQNMDYGSLTLEEAFDETSRNLADARTGKDQDSMCSVGIGAKS
uniref:Uncharacterized protein n=1 Tax=Solanum tuberosum TaxID=4113 RepID=M1B2U3_SOLTU